MNQTRNISINLLLNLIASFVVSYSIIAISNGIPWWAVIILYVFITVSLHIAFLLITLKMGKDGDCIFPPMGMLIILMLFWEYINGDVKIVKSMDYKVICHYKKEMLTIYYAATYYIRPLDSISFVGTEDDKKMAVYMISTYINELANVKKKNIQNDVFSFKKWDGASSC